MRDSPIPELTSLPPCKAWFYYTRDHSQYKTMFTQPAYCALIFISTSQLKDINTGQMLTSDALTNMTSSSSGSIDDFDCFEMILDLRLNAKDSKSGKPFCIVSCMPSDGADTLESTPLLRPFMWDWFDALPSKNLELLTLTSSSSESSW